MSIDDDVQAIVDGGEEADDILRASLTAVHAGVGAPWSAIAFVEERRMVIGPADRHGARRLPRPGARRCPSSTAATRSRRSGSASTTRAEVEVELERAAALLAPVLPRRLGHRRRGMGPLSAQTLRVKTSTRVPTSAIPLTIGPCGPVGEDGRSEGRAPSRPGAGPRRPGSLPGASSVAGERAT